MKLIINADDFGIDLDRDFGIFYGVISGYISSVSIVVTNKIGLIRKILVSIMKRKASVGIHINLTDNPLIKYTMEEICEMNYDYKRRKYVAIPYETSLFTLFYCFIQLLVYGYHFFRNLHFGQGMGRFYFPVLIYPSA